MGGATLRAWAGGGALSNGSRARAVRRVGAHSTLPLDAPLSAGVGLVLGICAHSVGWPFPRGGAQRISDALAGYFCALGGEITTGDTVTALPDAPAVMCDVSPRQLLALGGDRFPAGFRAALGRYRYGPGAFKLDWALDSPIPWKARECARAATVHLGGSMEEIAAWEAKHTGRPFVLLVQHTLFDPGRAPAGKHTAWAYCHVPHGSTADMTQAIEDQVERFAPGFRARILARSVMPRQRWSTTIRIWSAAISTAGVLNLRQLVFRPTRSLYETPLPGVCHLQRFDSAWRRRPRHVRLSRGSNCRLKVSGKRPISKPMDVMSAALGGMRTAQNSLEKTAERIAGAKTQPQDSVDLSTEMVEMLAAANQYQANARVIQNTDSMQKKLLNILA